MSISIRTPNLPTTYRLDSTTHNITMCPAPQPAELNYSTWHTAIDILAAFAINHGGNILDTKEWEFRFQPEEYIVCCRWFEWHQQYTLIVTK
jgi:hypothetical protein